MDVSTREQWMEIVDRTIEAQPRVARQILDMVRGLSAISDGFSVDQMQHALQTATRAERDGANEEVIVASLLHDVGKLISVPNHPKIAAEILKPYVHYDVDPDYPVETLEHFEPMVVQVFSQAHSI